MLKGNRQEQMEAAANKYDEEHPEVWELLVEITLEMIDSGFKRYGVNGIFEIVRYTNRQVGADGENVFKLSNNHRPYYARWFMETYPEYDGFFRTRDLTSLNKPAILKEQKPKDCPYTNAPMVK